MAVSLRLPDDLNIRLSNLADKTGRSKTFYMLEAIKQWVADAEASGIQSLRDFAEQLKTYSLRPATA